MCSPIVMVVTLSPNNTMTEQQWGVLHVDGHDAESFLQGQLTQDMSAVTSDPLWSLLLTPDSKIVALVHVSRTVTGFDLVLPQELIDASYARLKRFLLRISCTIESESVDVGPWLHDGDRIDLKFPGIGDFAKGFTPHTFGRSFVDATISFSKGCFTGQELVGRLDARGSSVPFRFVAFAAPDVASAEAVISSKGPEGMAGLSAIRLSSEGIRGLAVVHRTLLGDEVVSVIDGVHIDSIQ